MSKSRDHPPSKQNRDDYIPHSNIFGQLCSYKRLSKITAARHYLLLLSRVQNTEIVFYDFENLGIGHFIAYNVGNHLSLAWKEWS
jgi:hypothetical protein